MFLVVLTPLFWQMLTCLNFVVIKRMKCITNYCVFIDALRTEANGENTRFIINMVTKCEFVTMHKVSIQGNVIALIVIGKMSNSNIL